MVFKIFPSLCTALYCALKLLLIYFVRLMSVRVNYTTFSRNISVEVEGMVFERFEPVGVDCIPFSRDLKTRPTVCYITTYHHTGLRIL